MFTRDEMEQLGGQPWTHPKTAAIRIYLPHRLWQNLLGLQVTRYGTGNISYATLLGQRISNSAARRLLAPDCKVWWEDDGLLHTPAGSPLTPHLTELHTAIAQHLAMAVHEEPATAHTPTHPTTPSSTQDTHPADTVVCLRLPYGGYGPQTIDLTTLPPMARALAEALTQTSLAHIRVKSVRTIRQTYPPQHAEVFFRPDQLDQPLQETWNGWHTHPRTCLQTATDVLLYEAGKLAANGWYPIADDGSDLPSSAAARDTIDKAVTVQ